MLGAFLSNAESGALFKSCSASLPHLEIWSILTLCRSVPIWCYESHSQQNSPQNTHKVKFKIQFSRF